MDTLYMRHLVLPCLLSALLAPAWAESAAEEKSELTIEEAVRVGAKTLTEGSERFNEAEKLMKEGKAREAVAAFEKLQAEFPKTWVDRLSEERLRKLRPAGVK